MRSIGQVNKDIELQINCKSSDVPMKKLLMSCEGKLEGMLLNFDQFNFNQGHATDRLGTEIICSEGL